MNELISKNYDVILSLLSDAYIAQDINNTGSKVYYNMSWDDLLIHTKSNNNLYEIIRPEIPCKMYFDFDAKFEDMNEEQIAFYKNQDIKKIVKNITSHIKDFCEDNKFDEPFCCISNATTDKKFSIHICLKNIILPTNKHRKAFFNKFIEYIDGEDMILQFFDNNVYTKNRLMRLINQTKYGSNNPLTSLHKVKQSSHIITYTDGVDITSIPEDWLPVEKVYTPHPEDDCEFENDFVELKSLLSRISRNTEYKDWSLVGQVIFNITKGDDDGLEMFIDWSRTAHNFDEGGCYNLWKTYKINENYGIGVLVNMTDKEEVIEIKRLLPIKEKKIKDEVKEIVEISTHWTDTIIYDISDMYCAEIFAKYCEGEVFYTKGYGWIIFDKKTKFWSLNNTKNALIYPISKFFSENMKKAHSKFVEKYDPKNETDNKTLKLIMKTRKTVESSKFSKNILDHLENLLTKENDIIDNFDNKPNLIAFKNGFVIDLHNEGKSRPITKEDLLISHTGYNIPMRNEYYNKIYDIIRSMVETDDDMNSLCSLLSTFIYGDNANEMFFVLTGSGGNGKGVLDKMLQLALGAYYKTIDIKQLTNYEKDGGTRPNSELYNCRLARCVMTSEPETGSNSNKLITSTIKKWTGKDAITCRDLNKSSITFIPKFTLAINVNEIPLLSTKDGGIERRMKCYELPYKFVINEGQDLGEKEKYRDEDLKTLISTDNYKDQIILVLIDAWIKNMGKFYECKKVKEFTSNYMNEQNPIREWFNENYDINEDGKIPSNELYNEFKNYGSDISMTSFGRYLKELCQGIRSKTGIRYKCSKKSIIKEM